MAETTVFVDDAVLGHLPEVCVKHGDATEEWVVLSRPVGTSSLGVLWLLLLAGPFGIVALLILSASRSRDDLLTVRLPCCQVITRQFNAARRSRWIAGLGLLAIAVLALISLSHGTAGLWPYVSSFLVVGGVLALAEMVRDTMICRRSMVGIALDASRRWVTLRGVHPGFRSAVESDPDIRHASDGPLGGTSIR
jgi:hypothetical protein